MAATRAEHLGAGIHHVFIVAVENKQASNGSAMVVISGKVIATDAQTVVEQQHYCEQCADDSLGEASTTLARQLIRDLSVSIGVRFDRPGIEAVPRSWPSRSSRNTADSPIAQISSSPNRSDRIGW